MTGSKRRSEMLSLLEKHQNATVEQLVAWLGASPATVRRDIVWLANHQLLRRTRGGAAQASASTLRPLRAASFVDSLRSQVANKRAIARQAAALCRDGESIVIGAGTSTYMMSEYLGGKRLQILTNSFAMANQLISSGEHEVTVPGGSLYREQNIILSPFDEGEAPYARATKMFTGIGGIAACGLIETDHMLIRAQQRLRSHADQLIVLADSSKFNSVSGLILCGLNKVNRVITDLYISTDACSMLRDAGVHVDIVDPLSSTEVHH